MSEEEFYKKLKHNFFGTEDSEDFKELVKAYNDEKSIIKEAREYLINTNYDSDLPKLMEILDKAGEE